MLPNFPCFFFFFPFLPFLLFSFSPFLVVFLRQHPVGSSVRLSSWRFHTIFFYPFFFNHTCSFDTFPYFMSMDQEDEVSTSFAFYFIFIFLILFLYFYIPLGKGSMARWRVFLLPKAKHLGIGHRCPVCIFDICISRLSIGWMAATDESFSGREAQSS